MLKLRPTTIAEAKRFIARHHRHNDAPKSGLFAVACEAGGELCGVAIVGRPKARLLDDGTKCEVTQLATDGTRNACSILYASAARAAKAMGYGSIDTLTLAEEPGTSLIAAGWERVADIPARPTWSTPSRHRVQRDLFGDRRPTGPKVRWTKRLN